MQPASIDDIKKELQQQQPRKVLDLLLKLARFKKENKELLTYLLFEAGDEPGYVSGLKIEIDDLLAEVGEAPYTVIKKTLRKIPRLINKHVKYIGTKTSAAELHMHAARGLKAVSGAPGVRNIPDKLVAQQLARIGKLLPALDDDLRHDYEKQVAELEAMPAPRKSWWKK